MRNTRLVSCYTAPLRKHVGRKIRQARMDAGLSHDRLGERVGHGRVHLIRLEQGKHLPRPETLEAIAQATGRDVGWFLPDFDLDEAA